MYTTFTDDPIILDLIQKRGEALRACQEATEEEQRLYAERSPSHGAALTKMDKALQTLQGIEAELCVSFIWALEHSKKDSK